MKIAGLHGLREYGLTAIAMTTNGLALHRRLAQLVDSGLTHLNLRYIGIFGTRRPIL
jgi:GTP 3',8-cyclase